MSGGGRRRKLAMRIIGWLGGTGGRRALVLTLAAALALPGAAATAARPRAFDTPEQAVQALIEAARRGDPRALEEIFGPGTRALLSAGDPVEDRQVRERFVQAYDTAHRLEAGGGKVVLVVGPDEFPFPIPLVPDGPVWRFDARAGQEEILARRIGRNELAAIQVCLAIVDAQRDYYGQDRNGDGVLEYAQRFPSTPGKRDGLYWETGPGSPPSPLGPLVARARTVGYAAAGTSGPRPYWGYYYRMLPAQGPSAPGGAYDYVANGRMIGGFGVVAYPARYGVSGVMTFITSHDGVVYQKDLGPRTAALASQMKVFDPDQTWQRVAP
jgi:hypothetical protein